MCIFLIKVYLISVISHTKNISQKQNLETIQQSGNTVAHIAKEIIKKIRKCFKENVTKTHAKKFKLSASDDVSFVYCKSEI